MTFQAGDCVEVFGLESERGKELNGTRGILTKSIEGKGRFEIRILPDKVINVKPVNLKKVELTVAERLRILGLGGDSAQSNGEPNASTSNSRPRSRSRDRCEPQAGPESHAPPNGHGTEDATQSLPFKPGHCVEVVGLESESGQKLNGQTGIITRYLVETKRFEVRFVPDRILSLKAENLCKREFKFDDHAVKQNEEVDQKSRSRSRSHGQSSSSSSSSRSRSRSPPMSPLKPEQIPQPFVLGGSVEVFGLESEEGKLLNGQSGVITTYFKGKARFEVKLKSGKTVHLKPGNLRQCSDADAPSSACASEPQLEPKVEQAIPEPVGTSLASLLGLGRAKEAEEEKKPAEWQSVWSRSGGGTLGPAGALSQEEIDTFNALQSAEEERENEIKDLRRQVKDELVNAGAFCEDLFEQVFEDRLKEHQLMKALRPQEKPEAPEGKDSLGKRPPSRSSSSSSRSSSSRSPEKPEKLDAMKE